MASAIKEKQERKRGGYIDFFCGWSAGCIETILLYPQNKLIFRQQLHGVVVKEAVKQLKAEGMTHLYRGLLPPLIMRTTTRSIMFGMYEKYQTVLGCSMESSSSSITLCHAQAGFLAGATEATLCPLERTQTLLQSNAYHGQFKNTFEAVKVVSRYGFTEFYRGYSVIVCRNGLSNVLFFTLREPLKHQILEVIPTDSKHPVYHILSDFFSGAILGASISTIFFPINVVKTRMQATLGTKFENPFKIISIIWKERNGSLKELYRGVHLNFTRSLLAWGITNSAFNLLQRTFG
jgi:hypothetical protein